MCDLIKGDPNYFPYLFNLLSYIVGFLTAVFAEPFRRFLFKPNLVLEFGQTLDFLSKTPEKFGTITKNSVYIRVKIKNHSKVTAKECRCYLINIEKQNKEGEFIPTIYCDSIQLAWSCQNIGEQYRGFVLAKGVNQFFDIVTIRESRGDFEPQIMMKPFRYFGLFDEKGVFRFTVQAVADNADPKTFKMVLEWQGDFNNFKAYAG